MSGGGAFSRILYFGVQARIKNKPIFSCLCLGVVLLVAFCTSVYKQAPKTNLSLVVYVYGVVLSKLACSECSIMYL